LNGVQDGSNSRSQAKWNPQEKNKKRHDDEHRPKTKAGFFRHALVKDIPWWHSDVGLNKECDSRSESG
jgi:hypothetical protein